MENGSNLFKNLNSEHLKLPKMTVFGPFEFTKIWFQVKSERWLNDQISTKSSLNSHFGSFWCIVQWGNLRIFQPIIFLREINTVNLKHKKLLFDHFSSSEFWILWFFDIFKYEVPKKSKVKASIKDRISKNYLISKLWMELLGRNAGDTFC